jgi:hypothetical protein
MKGQFLCLSRSSTSLNTLEGLRMNQSSYQTLAQKPFETHYLHFEAVIDAPLKKVWEKAVHIGQWMNDHKLETLSGKPGELGHFEKVLPRGMDNVPMPRHHYYGIALLVPLKCISLEVFPEKGGSYGNPDQWQMFDHVLFNEVGGKTRIVLLMHEVHPGPAGAKARALGEEEVMRERLGKYVENLARLSIAP